MEVKLSSQELHQTICEDLDFTEIATGEKPLERDLPPPLGRVRIYAFNLCRSKGRRAGEFKIMLALSAHRQMDFDGALVVLAGYSPLYGVYALWDADLYQHFTYNRSVYAKEDELLRARRSGIATYSRPIRQPYATMEEVVVATRSNLHEALRLRRRLTQNRIMQEVAR